MDYIVLDMENMKCIAKCTSLTLACNMASLCMGSKAAYSVQPFDTTHCFNGMTSYELALLLHNTCGHDFSKWNIKMLQVAACYVFEQVPFTTVELSYIMGQLAWRDKNTAPVQKCNYVHGAYVPTIANDGCLFYTAPPPVNLLDCQTNWYKLEQELKEKYLKTLAGGFKTESATIAPPAPVKLQLPPKKSPQGVQIIHIPNRKVPLPWE